MVLAKLLSRLAPEHLAVMYHFRQFLKWFAIVVSSQAGFLWGVGVGGISPYSFFLAKIEVRNSVKDKMQLHAKVQNATAGPGESCLEDSDMKEEVPHSIASPEGKYREEDYSFPEQQQQSWQQIPPL